MLILGGVLLYLLIGFLFGILFQVLETSELTVNDILSEEVAIFAFFWPVAIPIWYVVEIKYKHGNKVLFRKTKKKEEANSNQ